MSFLFHTKSKRIKYLSLMITSVALFTYSFLAQSEEVPLWQIDGSISAISIDAYPGSSYTRNLVLPFPNFRLNSPYLQTSGGGVNARILNSDKLDIGLTMSGTLPTENKHLEVRSDRNMPDLDPTFEIGLGLKYVPLKNNDWEFKTQFPLRKATGIALKDQSELWRMHKPVDLGWTLSPRATLTRYIQVKDVSHEIDLEVGSRFATQQNMNYFYGVESQYALAGESAFDAKQGLVNNWVELGWVRKRDRWRFSISAEYQDLHDAKNVLSPLLEEKDTWFGFMILTYTFAESNLMVEQDSEFRN